MSDVSFEALSHACADAYKAGYEAGIFDAADKLKHLLGTARNISSHVVIETLEIAIRELEDA
jgi:hypothetical protein